MAHKSSQEVRIATTVAINRDKNSQHAVKWALDNLPAGIRQIVLVHVHTQLQPQDDVSQKIMEDAVLQKHEELQQFFLPYRGICARKGVRAKEVVLIDPDIKNALAEYISENAISAIVLGCANRNALTRPFRNLDTPSSLAKSVPDFCSIYTVSSRGKAQKLKVASRTPAPVCHKPSSPANLLADAPSLRDHTNQGVSRHTTSIFDGSSKGVSFERSTSPLHPVCYNNNVMPKISSWEKTPSPDIQFHAADSLSYCATEFSELSGPLASNSDLSYEQSDASSCVLSSQAMGEIDEEMRRLRQVVEEKKKSMDSLVHNEVTRYRKYSIDMGSRV